MMKEQKIRLYVVPGVHEDTLFETKTRKEISVSVQQGRADRADRADNCRSRLMSFTPDVLPPPDAVISPYVASSPNIVLLRSHPSSEHSMGPSSGSADMVKKEQRGQEGAEVLHGDPICRVSIFGNCFYSRRACLSC